MLLLALRWNTQLANCGLTALPGIGASPAVAAGSSCTAGARWQTWGRTFRSWRPTSGSQLPELTPPPPFPDATQRREKHGHKKKSSFKDRIFKNCLGQFLAYHSHYVHKRYNKSRKQLNRLRSKILLPPFMQRKLKKAGY